MLKAILAILVTHLLSYIRNNLAKKGLFILSTPERDLRRGPEHMGPPGNHAQIREWNKKEFSDYLIFNGISILDHIIVDHKEGMKTCQLVLATFK